jgi:hypothetical protein
MAAASLRRNDPGATRPPNDGAQLVDCRDLLGTVDQCDQRRSRLIEGETTEWFVAGS